MSKKLIATIKCCKCGKIFDANIIIDSKKLHSCKRLITYKDGKMGKIHFGPGATLWLDNILCNECAAEHYRYLKGE